MQKKSKKLSNMSKCNSLINIAMLKRRKFAYNSIAKTCDYEFKMRIIK